MGKITKSLAVGTIEASTFGLDKHGEDIVFASHHVAGLYQKSGLILL